MEITQQQYEELQPYGDILLKAACNKYLTQAERREADRSLRGLYERISGVRLRTGCGSCAAGMKWLHRLGVWYEEYESNNN